MAWPCPRKERGAPEQPVMTWPEWSWSPPWAVIVGASEWAMCFSLGQAPPRGHTGPIKETSEGRNDRKHIRGELF